LTRSSAIGFAALDDLSNDPTPAQVKALAGSGGLCRIRVGDWRIIYTIERDDSWHG